MRLIALVLLLSLTSCTRYYLCIADDPVVVFSDPALLKYDYVLPEKSQIMVTEKPGHYYLIKSTAGSGYIKKRKFRTRVRYSRSTATAFHFESSSNSAGNSTPTQRPSSATTPRKKSTSPVYSPGRTVNVRGYYRKNGTYVRPHTRSAPRRR